MGSNHLVNETSPYLLQHKNNPVDWYPWGNEAFEKAKKEDKLIFLSIGYSTCHWCHVMAHECFEDDEVANILNKYYISIKVDREQYPHIDQYYQDIYHILNKKGGGWPLTIILTSDMKPVFAGTYIPKYGGYGSKGLIEILQSIKDISINELNKFGDEVLQKLEYKNSHSNKKEPIDIDIENKTISQYKSYYDFKNKGFSIQPKFPHASSIDILLDIYNRTNDKYAYDMAIDSLEAMANGGIYDQIDGGFYRYSVDKYWQVPHFEKMLYTNAELISVYTKAYKLTKNELFKNIVIDTINEMDKRFMVNNLYKSASNADSKNFDGKNEEGFYFIYDYDTIYAYLEKYNIKNIKKSLAYFGILPDGNIDGDFSNPFITTKLKPDNIDEIKVLLKKYREQKQYPFIDNKINTAWNALYLDAKLNAAIFKKQYLNEALNSLDSLLKTMYKDEVLYHQTIDGKIATQKGLLEDYSFLSSALFSAYQLTLDEKYFILFEKLIKQSIELFYKNNRWQNSNDGFNSYASLEDNAYQNPLANLLKNIVLYSTVEADFNSFNIVKTTLEYFSSELNNYSSYYPTVLQILLLDKYPAIFIKSNKQNLHNISFEDLKYPFIYKKVYKNDDYLACTMSSCFAYSKNFDDIKKAIEKK